MKPIMNNNNNNNNNNNEKKDQNNENNSRMNPVPGMDNYFIDTNSNIIFSATLRPS